MTPSNALLDQLQNLLATDATTLAPAVGGVSVHLAKAAFTPAPTLALASLTEADFAGSASLIAGTGTQQAFLDPITGLRIIQLLEPAGGWHWEATGAPVPAQTIFGFYVTDNANTVLYGSQLLATAVTITAIGDGLDIANTRFAMPPSALQ